MVLPGILAGILCALHCRGYLRYDRRRCSEENRYRQQARFKAGYDRGYRVYGGLPYQAAADIQHTDMAVHLDRRHRIHQSGKYRSRIYTTERFYIGAFRDEQGDRRHAVRFPVDADMDRFEIQRGSCLRSRDNGGCL